MSDADRTPVEATAETDALVRDYAQKEETMPLEHADLDPLRESIADAVKSAARAETAADEALRISKSNSDQLMGLAVTQQRTEAFARRTEETLLEHKRNSETRHNEVLEAIGGAMKNDKALADKQAAIESKLSNGDIGKIAGGVTALLVAIAGAVTLAATQLAPILPSVVQAKYGQPSVVVTVQPSPSAAPAVSK